MPRTRVIVAVKPFRADDAALFESPERAESFYRQLLADGKDVRWAEGTGTKADMLREIRRQNA